MKNDTQKNMKRKARLEQALRANLLRRKAQARQRHAQIVEGKEQEEDCGAREVAITEKRSTL